MVKTGYDRQKEAYKKYLENLYKSITRVVIPEKYEIDSTYFPNISISFLLSITRKVILDFYIDISSDIEELDGLIIGVSVGSILYEELTYGETKIKDQFILSRIARKNESKLRSMAIDLLTEQIKSIPKKSIEVR